MRIAITGATGHIGNNLVCYLYSKGYNISAIYRNSNKAFVFEDFNIEHFVGDILDYKFIENSLEGMDVVIHLAGKISIDGDPDGSVMKTNTIGVKNVVDACIKLGIKKLIHFSSIHAFKISKYSKEITENALPADNTGMAYDFTKSEGEKYVCSAIEKGMDAYIVHPTGVIGPRDYFQSYSGIMLSKLFCGKLPALLEGGFDWVDVRDICEGVEKIIHLEKNNEKNILKRRFIFSGTYATINEIAELCCDVSKKKKPRFMVSKRMALFGLPFIKTFAKLSGSAPIYTKDSIDTLIDEPLNFSHEKARKELGYVARSLDDTIKDCYTWYSNQRSK